MITVALADDQALVRAGLRMILSAESDIDVVGEAADGAEAVTLCARLRPDVVVMDLRMPVVDGVTATARITSGDVGMPDQITRVLVVTTFDDDEALYGALRAGASGYVLKHAAPREIAEAARRVAGGEAWIDPVVAPRVLQALRDLTCSGEPSSRYAVALSLLTNREREVLALVAEGLSNREIKDRLVLSEATVKTHVARILMKTGSRDRAAAVALAYQSGFVRAAV